MTRMWLCLMSHLKLPQFRWWILFKSIVFSGLLNKMLYGFLRTQEFLYTQQHHIYQFFFLCNCQNIWVDHSCDCICIEMSCKLCRFMGIVYFGFSSCLGGSRVLIQCTRISRGCNIHSFRWKCSSIEQLCQNKSVDDKSWWYDTGSAKHNIGCIRFLWLIVVLNTGCPCST